MDIRQCFGNNVRNIRKNHKLSQEQLAEKLHIESSTLSSLENGKSFVSYETLKNLCEVFNVTPKILFDFDITSQSTDSLMVINELHSMLMETDYNTLKYLYKIARILTNQD